MERVEVDELDKNYAAQVVTSTRRVTEKRPFSHDEVQKIFSYLKTHGMTQWAFACMAAYHNGFRLSDATSLKVSDFVTDTTGRTVVMVSPKKKSRGGERKPIPFPVTGEFKELYLELAPNAVDGKLTPDLPSRSNASKQFVRIIGSAGVETQKTGSEQGNKVHSLSFHSWRRTSKTNMDNAGVHPRVADRINDHDDPRTARLYSEIGIEAMEEAVGMATRRVWG